MAALVGLGVTTVTLALTFANAGDTVFGALTLLAILPYIVSGFFVAWRRPSNPIGWLVLALPISFGSSVLLGQYAIFALRSDAPLGVQALWLSFWLWVPGWLALGLVFLLFPDGRLPSARWRPVVRVISVATVLAGLMAAFNNDPRGTPTGRTNPLALDLPFSLYDVGIAFLILVFVVPAVSLVARYRGADGRVRRQLKWLAYGASVLVVLAVGYLVVLRTAGEGFAVRSADVLFLVGIAAPAIAIGVAILRDRVFDIDVLMNRTLVYAAVSAVLIGTYVAAVVSLQSLLRPLTTGSDLAVAASTLVVVALFQPIRRRVQELVDRRFYRSRYDAARTLDSFTARLRNEVDIDSVRADLLDIVGETVRPSHASVWLRETR